MQLDDLGREGIDDSAVTSIIRGKTEDEVDLEEHFKKNGLSDQSYSKISNHVKSGDINVKILINCDDNELQSIANEYKFSFIQKKGFLKVCTFIKTRTTTISRSIITTTTTIYLCITR